ncbi:hypothetical protein COO60DRAFT_1068071 [Scenedesmus sp. NREL 46B-D3]|nr:hypothetical protein COO60DRAFT_1068071 [Scenedesmus sp. NREL 46B-D3]
MMFRHTSSSRHTASVRSVLALTWLAAASRVAAPPPPPQRSQCCCMTGCLVCQQASSSGSSARREAAKPQQLQVAWQALQSRLAAGVDAAKQSAAGVPLVVVGGAAGLCGDTLPGDSRIIRPPHGQFANAVGAATPQIAGTVATLLLLHGEATRQQQLDAVVRQAVAAAVKAGAERGSCKVVELEEVPVVYASAGATRVHVKVAGQLQLEVSEAAFATTKTAPPAPPPGVELGASTD